MQDHLDQLSATQRALLQLRELRAQLETHERRLSEPIAIVGIGCRFPGGADDPDAMWRMLREGVDAISEVPADRFDVDRFYDPNPDAPGKIATRWGGFLPSVDRFDPEFFGISSREASTLDPQQRLLLEVTWEALERAGYAPDRLFGSPTGVFVGIGSFDYMQLQLQRSTPERIDAYLATGGCHSVASGRLSYVLGLQGPSISVDTACSSSLVAVHLACQSLRARECHLAVAGGVNVILSPELLINFSRAHMMAADGRCKVFDAAADGFVRAEGCGMIVLQRLGDALAERANILAVIRGSAINQDGRSSGLTAPNGPSQQAVIRAALANAGIQPADVQYVEAHGTGTSLGDPIEVQALGAALSEGRAPASPLRIGSIKTNIGHAEAAAGIAGLIKVVLSLQHGEIPPHLHFRQPSPHIAWNTFPIAVTGDRTPWPSGSIPRTAGISSFGFSGTNAHVVVQEAPALPAVASEGERPIHVVTLSARHGDALRELAGRYADRLSDLPDADLPHAAYTANVGRAHAAHRLAVTARTASQAREALRAFADGQPRAGAIHGTAPAGGPGEVVFLFAGQGSQYRDMGRQLYETAPTFRQAMERCDELLRPHLDRSILSVIYPAAGEDTPLDQTAYTQPALFALEYSLCELWKSWGIEPAAVVGHSLGEDVAACVAGVFGLEEGLELIAARGRLMQSLPRDGEMVAVFAEEARVRAALDGRADRVAIAAINGPAQVTVSGERTAVREVVSELEACGVRTRPVTASHAFHSPLMDSMLAPFERLAARLRYAEPSVPFVSNVSGRLAEPGEVANATYWRRHVRETVRFAAGVRSLYERGYRLFLEIGPNATLCGMGRNVLEETDVVWVSSLKQGRDWDHIAESLGTLYTSGVKVDWEGFDRRHGRRRIAMPTSPFRRKRYWFEEDAGAGRSAAAPVWPALVAAGREQADMVPIDLAVHTYAAKWEALDRLSAGYIVRAFREAGAFTLAGQRLTTDEILAAGGILATYRHLLGRWGRTLAAKGLLRESGDAFIADTPLPAPDIEALEAAAKAELADVPFLFEYVERSGRLMSAILTGRESALETLFPGGSPETAEQIYHRWALSRYFGGIGRALIEAVVKSLPYDRPVRVVEVGAGTGGLTTSLVPALPADRTVYCYTDVSEFFFADARRRFRAYPFLRYGLLDAERPPQEQGYGAHAFDVVVAANVLHATRRLDETLAHVRSLLAPGGVLLLYEVTNPPSWFDVSIALIEGWQRFDDGLRGDGPLLPREQWEALLGRGGFETCQAFPQADAPTAILGAHMFVARVAGTSTGREIAPDVLSAGEAAAAEETEAAPAVPGADSRLHELARLPARERHERLVAYVREHVMRVLARDESEPIGRRDRLMDLGIDSLMAVELRDRLATGLALPRRLPATLIFDYPHVEAIASLVETLLPDAAPADALREAVEVAVAAGEAQIAGLSDADVEALLRRKLESL